MSKESKKDLVQVINNMPCPACGSSMKKVSWKVTASAFDAGEEVEQTVFRCEEDKRFISVEVSTGNRSEFAFENLGLNNQPEV